MDPFEDLMDPAVQACPYSLYQRLRTEAPIYRMPATGFYLVTSFDLCREIIRQPDIFISGVSPLLATLAATEGPFQDHIAATAAAAGQSWRFDNLQFSPLGNRAFCTNIKTKSHGIHVSRRAPACAKTSSSAIFQPSR